IELLRSNFPLQINHVWHEDKGWRKNKILNEAIRVANSDLLIFVDGDCIPHSKFIEEHINHSELNVCNTGRRVNLSDKITGLLTEDKIKSGWLEKNTFNLILDGITGNSVDVEKGFYFRNKLIRNFLNKKQRGLLGCNFSIHKNDFLSINGFDERYKAPSIGEDSDVQFRLELKGIKIRSLNNIAVQYHLYHKLLPRPEENLKLFEQVKKEKEAYTPFGINRQ
ncbi:MAG: glycosyltransferase, partial [Ignavibacteria bacterium]